MSFVKATSRAQLGDSVGTLPDRLTGNLMPRRYITRNWLHVGNIPRESPKRLGAMGNNHGLLANYSMPFLDRDMTKDLEAFWCTNSSC